MTGGGGHTCALLTDSGVACWGDDNYGQIGTGAFGADYDHPVRITLPSPGTAKAVSAGRYNTCVVLTDGKVSCWGSDQANQLGNGPSTDDRAAPQPPVTLPSPGTALAIAVGDEHVCALLTSGAVTCWGQDVYGQLGNGSVLTAQVDVPGPAVDLPAPGTATMIAAGQDHTCAVLTGGALSCWGYNGSNKLGDGTSVGQADSPELTLLTADIAAVVTGENHTCALTTGGQVQCWGDDRDGQAGNGNENGDQSVPSSELATGNIAVLDVAAGSGTTCARGGVGKVSCWGSDYHGVVGNGAVVGDVISPAAPLVFPGNANVAQVDVGDYNACALSNGGLVTCWGPDGHGQLGNGAGSADVDAPPVPITLPAPGTASQIALGSEHACALLTDGTVTCWGLDSAGQLGNGAGSADVDAPPTPITLPAPGTAVSITAGAAHTCAVLTGGAVTCWGDDTAGQLGNGAAGSQTSPPAPIALPGGASAVSVSAGLGHTCALLVGGGVACWGLDVSGQMGDSANLGNHQSATLVPLPAPGTATDLDAGGQEACVVLTGGAVSCWGAGDDGQIGNGMMLDINDAPSAPISLPGPGSASRVAVGYATACAVLTDARLSCWGSDNSGQVGDGPIDPRVQAVPSTPFLAAGRTVTAVPQPVSGLQVTPTPTAMTITWTLPAPQTLLSMFVVVDPGIVQQVAINATSAVVNGLQPDTAYTIRVRTAHAFAGSDSALVMVTTPSLPTTTTGAPTTTTTGVSLPSGPEFTPFNPARLLDTRTDPGRATIDGLFLGGGRRDAGSTLVLQVAGRAGVSTTAKAAALNITATETGGAGFITVYPCDQARPNASNVNFVAGETVPNAVIAALAADGTVCLFTSQPTHLIADLNGVFPSTTTYLALNPARLIETRVGIGLATVDGLLAGGGRLAAGTAVEIQVAGRGGVPTDARAVALNATAVDAGGAGFATVYPCDRSRPNASNLNFVSGSTVANAVVSALSATGSVCVFSSQSTHLVVDVNGAFPSNSPIVTLDPARLLETRSGAGLATIDGQFQGGGRVVGGSVTTLQVSGRGGVPLGATAVALNVTVVDAAADGFATVFPCDQPRPNASNLNFVRGQTVPNAVLAALSGSGTVCLFASQDVDLVADVNAVLTVVP